LADFVESVLRDRDRLHTTGRKAARCARSYTEQKNGEILIEILQGLSSAGSPRFQQEV
jgi:hypothetical protein